MESEQGEHDGKRKPGKGLARVVVLPEFGGLRVVEVERAPLFEVGELIVWSEVSSRSHQGGVSTFASRGDRDMQSVVVRGGNRGNRLAERLKRRATRMKADDPVFVYAPKRESVGKYLAGSVVFLVLAAGLFVYMAVQVTGGFAWPGFGLKLIGFALILFFGTCLGWMALLIAWSFHRARPRSPQYDRVAVSELGFRLERDGALPIEGEWAGVARVKKMGSEPMRLRLDLASGGRLWVTVPKRAHQEVLSRVPVSLGGIDLNEKKSVRPMVWMGVRFFLLGLLGAGGSYALLVWLRSVGLLLPADFRRFVGPMMATCLFTMSYLAFAMLFVAWRNTPKGRRTLRRWGRGVERRFGCQRARRTPAA